MLIIVGWPLGSLCRAAILENTLKNKSTDSLGGNELTAPDLSVGPR